MQMFCTCSVSVFHYLKTKKVHFEDIMLREVSWTQKDKYSDGLYEVSRVIRFIETERRMLGAKGWEQREE